MIDAWLLLKPNRKSYALYRMVTLPMTLTLAITAPVSVKILPIATQQSRNYLYDKS